MLIILLLFNLTVQTQQLHTLQPVTDEHSVILFIQLLPLNPQRKKIQIKQKQTHYNINTLIE